MQTILIWQIVGVQFPVGKSLERCGFAAENRVYSSMKCKLCVATIQLQPLGVLFGAVSR